MHSNGRFGIEIGGMYMLLIAIIISTLSTAQELRPSEHGLEYQNESPAGNKSPEMTTFFQGSPSSSMPSSMEQPRAMNSSDPAWWSWGGGRRSEEWEKEDHVKKVVLLVVSLVCAVTGVAFLVVAAFVVVFRFQHRTRSSSSPLEFHDK